MDELLEHGALGAGRPTFVVAALAGAEAAPWLASALGRVSGVREVVGAAGAAEPDGPDARPAVVAAASLEAPRGALDVGAALAREIAAEAGGRSLPGLGVAASVHAPGASTATLVAVALEGARVVRRGRGGAPGVAHSELYELEARRAGRRFAAAGPAPAPDATDGGAAALLPRPARPGGDGARIGALEARADAALVAQLRAEVEGLTAERGRADRAAHRAAIDARLRALTARLDAAEAPGVAPRAPELA